jgi:hypothetical protein
MIWCAPRAVGDRIVGACRPDARAVADVVLREAVQLPQQRAAGSLEIRWRSAFGDSGMCDSFSSPGRLLPGTIRAIGPQP